MLAEIKVIGASLGLICTGVILGLAMYLKTDNNLKALNKQIGRLSSIIGTLRKRQIRIVRSITWFKTPETDIRVLKVQAREQLAIDLENGGAIEYIISEHFREDIQETEITVKARIKILNMK